MFVTGTECSTRKEYVHLWNERNNSRYRPVLRPTFDYGNTQYEI